MTKLASTILINEVEIKTATNGKNYKKLVATQVDSTSTFAFDFETAEMTQKVLPTFHEPRGFMVWETNYDGTRKNMDYMTYRQSTSFPGAFVTREVETYKIERDGQEDFFSNEATIVVLGDNTSEEWEAKVVKAFKKSQFNLPGQATKAKAKVEAPEIEEEELTVD